MLNADADQVGDARLVVQLIVGPEIVQKFHIYQEFDMWACRKNNPPFFHADKIVWLTYLCPGRKGLALCCND